MGFLRWYRGKIGLSVVLLAAAAGAVCVSPSRGQTVQSQEVVKLPSLVGSRPLPYLRGATGWLNSPPLTAPELRGKVVLVDFWDYSCINCIRAIPYIRAWADKYRASGLVVIGVHTPEFDIEKQTANVERAVKRFNITYPVALDNNQVIWNGFHNQFWPADYFVDASGRVRFEQFGEGNYAQSERWIQQLLEEAHAKQVSTGISSVHGQGVEASADGGDMESPETYIGYARAAHFASAGGLRRDHAFLYQAPAQLPLNGWSLAGNWEDHGQGAVLEAPGGSILFRFHARDLHLVMAPADGGSPVRFKVTIDGRAPGQSHGLDTDAAGNGVVTTDRLYQLVRQRGTIGDHTFRIEFADAGVQAFSFTFG